MFFNNTDMFFKLLKMLRNDIAVIAHKKLAKKELVNFPSMKMSFPTHIYNTINANRVGWHGSKHYFILLYVSFPSIKSHQNKTIPYNMRPAHHHMSTPPFSVKSCPFRHINILCHKI